MRPFRIALAQINSTVGDLDGNYRLIIDRIAEARELGADLVAFPELALPGYPPEDLLLKPSFIRESRLRLDQIIEDTVGITAVVGCVDASDGTDIFNAAAIISDGQLVHMYHKIFLPNYGVFDEERYFQTGDECPIFTVKGARVGVNICEDIWFPGGPTSVQRAAGAEIIVNINGSPFHRQKRETRHKMLATRAMDNGLIVTYTNLVGGQDELVFDGASVIFDQSGELVIEGKQFQDDLVVADLDVGAVFAGRLHDPRSRRNRWATAAIDIPTPIFHISNEAGTPEERPPVPKRKSWEPLSPAAEVHQALVIGTRDYVRKSGFQQVLIGMSGGIDSALTAAIAAEALGPEHVTAVTMPSRYSSAGSVDDSTQLAENLGITLHTIPIEPAFKAYLQMLKGVFAETEPNIAEENLQARVRGNILMAMSNKFGRIVLTTGNKSEMATGYATLYGDMAGGFAVIKDVPKTLVYEVSEHINAAAGRELIPRAIIEKEPSAELRPDQLDTDSLPPYSVLDPILEAYVEEDRSFEEIVTMGFDEAAVRQAVRLVDRTEYKRRQTPPGVKITPRAFGRDRRLPIVNKFNPI